MNKKPWYKSVTMWGIFLTAASALLGQYPEVAELVGSEATAEALTTLGELVGLVIAAIGRMRAKTEITR